MAVYLSSVFTWYYAKDKGIQFDMFECDETEKEGLILLCVCL